MLHVHFNIGSNLGDREDNIKRAVASLLRLACDISGARVSSIYTSAPWGFDSDNQFYNVGVSFDTRLEPEALLAATQRIERSISASSHRDASGAYIDRIIDIDIIAAVSLPQSAHTPNPQSAHTPHPQSFGPFLPPSAATPHPQSSHMPNPQSFGLYLPQSTIPAISAYAPKDFAHGSVPEGCTLIEIDTPSLTLPHPHALQRDFVLTPLREIDPALHTLLTR